MNRIEEQMMQIIENIINNKQEEIKKNEYEDFSKYVEMSAYENDLMNENIDLVAGVDEVGRGPLAGPVVAAAVILPSDFYLPGLNDSKQLSLKKRELFFKEIITHAVTYGIGVCTVDEIDRHNILYCSKQAMKRAIDALSIKPKHLLIDAVELEQVDIPSTSIIKGDAKSVSIAAASIVAKVSRDLYMKKLDEKYPQYLFKNNAGYGTRQHLDAIKKYGVTNEHRKTFEPIKTMLDKKKTLFDI